MIFDIIPGLYNENIRIFQIPGSSAVNTLTVKSQTNNFNDVIVNNVLVSGSNISRDSSIDSTVEISAKVTVSSENVDVINNKFNNNNINVYADWLFSLYDLNFTGNIDIANLVFYGEFWISSGRVDTVLIKNNTVNGDLTFYLCDNFKLENNTINGNLNFENPCYNFEISKNKIVGDFINGANSFKISKNKITGKIITSGELINNFISGKLQYNGGICIE
ncbi:MAG: hypothetical protein R3A12_16635 [Ignavibacteria bacterium]